jgi:uncharacterized membrane protein HdeD (DUF308 family)
MQNQDRTDKNPSALRILQIVLGIISVIISGLVISHIFIAVEFITTLLAIALLAIGIERLGMGILSRLSSKSSKISNIILGALTIILAIIVIIYPSITTSFILVLLSVSLIVIGIARIISTIKDKTKGWKKNLMMGIGILSIIVGGMIIANYVVGLFLVSLILGISLLINGIESIILGVSGKRKENHLK